MIDMAHIFDDAHKLQSSAPTGDTNDLVEVVSIAALNGADEKDLSSEMDAELASIDLYATALVSTIALDDETVEGRCSISPTCELLETSEIERLRQQGMAKWRLNRSIRFYLTIMICDD